MYIEELYTSTPTEAFLIPAGVKLYNKKDNSKSDFTYWSDDNLEYYTTEKNILVPASGVLRNNDTNNESDWYYILKFTDGIELYMPNQYLYYGVSTIVSQFNTTLESKKYKIIGFPGAENEVYCDTNISLYNGIAKISSSNYVNLELLKLGFALPDNAGYGDIQFDQSSKSFYIRSQGINSTASPIFTSDILYDISKNKGMLSSLYINSNTYIVEVSPYMLLDGYSPYTTSTISSLTEAELIAYIRRTLRDEIASKHVTTSQSGSYTTLLEIPSTEIEGSEKYGDGYWCLAFKPFSNSWYFILKNKNTQEPIPDTVTQQPNNIEQNSSIIYNTEVPSNINSERTETIVLKNDDGETVANNTVSNEPDAPEFNFPVPDPVANLYNGDDLTDEKITQYQHNYKRDNGEPESNILSRAADYDLHNETPQTRSDIDHLKKINRFGFVTTHDGAPGKKSFIFMTRPDLNFFYKQESNSTEDSNISGLAQSISFNSEGTLLSSEVTNIPVINYIYSVNLDVLTSLEYLDWTGVITDPINTPWLTVVSNYGSDYQVQDRKLGTVDMSETIHGNKITYGTSDFTNEHGGTISLRFRERRDLSVYYTFKAWTEYIHNVHIGKISPKISHKFRHELDYASSLYYIVTDETMENILYWEKLIGVFPTTCPDNIFEEGDSTSTYNISFNYSLRSVLDQYDLYELNSLYGSLNKSSVDTLNVDSSVELSSASNYMKIKNTEYGKHLLDLADFYRYTDNESMSEIFNKYLNNDDVMRRLYYMNKTIPSEEVSSYLTAGSYGYDMMKDGTVDHNVPFLPNYIPGIRDHGIPYVKGPYITKTISQHNNISSTLFKLRWI